MYTHTPTHSHTHTHRVTKTDMYWQSFYLPLPLYLTPPPIWTCMHAHRDMEVPSRSAWRNLLRGYIMLSENCWASTCCIELTCEHTTHRNITHCASREVLIQWVNTWWTCIADPYLSTYTVYPYWIRFFHCFGGIRPYWKKDTGKHNLLGEKIFWKVSKQFERICWMSTTGFGQAFLPHVVGTHENVAATSKKA